MNMMYEMYMPRVSGQSPGESLREAEEFTWFKGFEVANDNVSGTYLDVNDAWKNEHAFDAIWCTFPTRK